MPINSRQKGARAERRFRDVLRAEGYLKARRGRQFCGGPDSPDVVCPELDFIHWEIKAVERLNIEDAMDQARRDGARKIPVVAHKRNHRRWLVTMEAEFFFDLIREFDPAVLTPRRQGANILADGLCADARTSQRDVPTDDGGAAAPSHQKNFQPA